MKNYKGETRYVVAEQDYNGGSIHTATNINYFQRKGYKTRKEAADAIERFAKNTGLCKFFFIIEGYATNEKW
jgi:hypothetical protein